MINFSLTRYKLTPSQPKRHSVLKFIRRSLISNYQSVMLTVDIVDIETSQELNLLYRGIDKPTNVISLEYPQSRNEFNFLTGELILADDIIVSEALQQGKSIESHYAHMIVHGVLHLQGYDHQEEDEAEIMENLEIQILQSLGFSNPYLGYHEII